MRASSLLFLTLVAILFAVSASAQGILAPTNQFFTSQFGFPSNTSLSQTGTFTRTFAQTLPAVSPFRASSIYAPITVSFVAAFPTYVDQLKVTLSKDGISVDVFVLDRTNPCFGGFEDGGSQILLNDDAQSISKRMWSCVSGGSPVNGNIPNFRQGQAYAIQPANPLAAFDNTPIAGVWTLTIAVNTTGTTLSQAGLNLRNFYGWGLTFGAVYPPAGSYLLPGNLTPGQEKFDFCPAKSVASIPGFNTINSCPCQAGYEASTAFQCRPCQVAFYRALSTQTQANFQLYQGRSQCLPCNSVPAVPILAAYLEEQCASVSNSAEYLSCLPGFELFDTTASTTSNLRKGACTACPQGTFTYAPATNLIGTPFQPNAPPPVCLSCSAATRGNSNGLYNTQGLGGVGSTTFGTGAVSTFYPNSFDTSVCTCDKGYFPNPAFPAKLDLTTLYTTGTAPNQVTAPAAYFDQLASYLNYDPNNPTTSVATPSTGFVPQCFPCDYNTYKDTIGNGACISCGPNAISGLNSASCTCINSGYTNYITLNNPSASDPAGLGCAPTRFFKRRVPSSSVCSQSCDGGFWQVAGSTGQSALAVTCEDANGVVYADSMCEGVNGQHKVNFMYPAVCNINPCVVNGYTPQFSSGVLNNVIPFGLDSNNKTLRTNSTIRVKASGQAFTVNPDNSITYTTYNLVSDDQRDVYNTAAQGFFAADAGNSYVNVYAAPPRTANANPTTGAFLARSGSSGTTYQTGDYDYTDLAQAAGASRTTALEALGNIAVTVTIQWPLGQRFDNLRITLQNTDFPNVPEFDLLNFYPNTWTGTSARACSQSGVGTNRPIPTAAANPSTNVVRERRTKLPFATAGGYGQAQLVFTDNAALPALTCQDGVSRTVLRDGEAYIVRPSNPQGFEAFFESNGVRSIEGNWRVNVYGGDMYGLAPGEAAPTTDVVNTHRLISWGISLDVSQCAQQQGKSTFLPGGLFFDDSLFYQSTTQTDFLSDFPVVGRGPFLSYVPGGFAQNANGLNSTTYQWKRGASCIAVAPDTNMLLDPMRYVDPWLTGAPAVTATSQNLPIVAVGGITSAPCNYGRVPQITRFTTFALGTPAAEGSENYQCRLCSNPDFINSLPDTDYNPPVVINDHPTNPRGGADEVRLYSVNSSVYYVQPDPITGIVRDLRPGLSVDSPNYARIVTTAARPIRVNEYTLWGQYGTTIYLNRATGRARAGVIVSNGQSAVSTFGDYLPATYTSSSLGWPVGTANHLVATASPFSMRTQYGKFACVGCGSDNYQVKTVYTAPTLPSVTYVPFTFASALYAPGQACFGGADVVPCAPGYMEDPTYAATAAAAFTAGWPNYGSGTACVPCGGNTYAVANPTAPSGYDSPQPATATSSYDPAWLNVAQSNTDWTKGGYTRNYAYSKHFLGTASGNSATCGGVCKSGQVSPSGQSLKTYGANYGAQSQRECVCPAGTYSLGGAQAAYLQDGNCLPCAANGAASNTFEDRIEDYQGDSVLRQAAVYGGYQGCPKFCPPNSVALPPYNKCTCNPGYESYDRNPNNPSVFTCSLVRSFSNVVYGYNGVAGGCSAPCGPVLGTQTLMSADCTDRFGVVYANSTCLVNNAPLNATRTCGGGVCVANGYQPQFPSAVINRNIPSVLGSTSLQQVPSAAVSDTIIIPEGGAPVIGDIVNSLTVHFNGQYANNLWALRISLTHAGVTVPLFSIPANNAGNGFGQPTPTQEPSTYTAGPNPTATGSCALGAIQKYSQLNFNDHAGLPPILCSTPQTPNLLGDEAYVVQPAYGSQLAAFNDLPLSGAWTLSVWSAGGATGVPGNVPRIFLSWGLTFNTTMCNNNQFTPTPSINSGVCAACSTNSFGITAGVNSINSCPCREGYDGIIGNTCTACPVNTYRGPITSFYVPAPTPEVSPTFQLRQNASTCISCNSSTASTGSTLFSQCLLDCFPGYQLTPATSTTPARCLACPAGSFKSIQGGLNYPGGAPQCQPCPLGQFQPLAGQATCLPCAGNATTLTTGSLACSCKTGFGAPGNLANGSYCFPTPFWDNSVAFTNCSSPCENGFQTRPLRCVDMFGTVYDNFRCAGLAPIATVQACNNNIPCTKGAYIPQYGTGLIVAANQLLTGDNIYPLNYRGSDSGQQSRITATGFLANNGTINSTTPLAIHLELQYVKYLQTLRIELTHSNWGGPTTTAVLFALDNTIPCLGGFGDLNGSTSITFSDQATLPALTCNNANLLNLLAGENYVVPPTEPLTKFYGQPITGMWTINLKVSANIQYGAPYASKFAQNRFITSWGITHAPLTCPPKQFISSLIPNSPARLYGAGVTCRACPDFSTLITLTGLPQQPGTAFTTALNSINSCPCGAGYHSGTPETCTACPVNTFRAVSPFSSPAYQQRQGVATCQPCHSSSLIATPLAVQCGVDCDPGYMFNAAFGCVACPNGYYKTDKSANACTRCPVGFSTVNQISTNSSQCACAEGYETDPNVAGGCRICPAGSYKEYVGAGQCKLCAYNAENVPGASKCVCQKGFTDLSAIPHPNNGTGCTYARFWGYNAWSACTSTCEAALQYRAVFCTDVTGATFADSDCSSVPKPSGVQMCPANLQFSCTRNGYVSNFPSWAYGLNIGSAAPLAMSGTAADVTPLANNKFPITATTYDAAALPTTCVAGVCPAGSLNITDNTVTVYDTTSPATFNELAFIINLESSRGAQFGIYAKREGVWALSGAPTLVFPLINFGATSSPFSASKCPLVDDDSNPSASPSTRQTGQLAGKLGESPLAPVNSSIIGAYAGQPTTSTQFVITDNAVAGGSDSTPGCNLGSNYWDKNTYATGESYSVAPPGCDPFAATAGASCISSIFGGASSTDGKWSLFVVPISGTVTVRSWSIALNPTECPIGSYVAPPAINGPCVKAPANSVNKFPASVAAATPTEVAFQTIQTYPCALGFDASTPYSCRACPDGTYDVKSFLPYSYPFQQGVNTCLSCNAAPTGAVAGTFTDPTTCGINCNPGFYFAGTAASNVISRLPAGPIVSNTPDAVWNELRNTNYGTCLTCDNGRYKNGTGPGVVLGDPTTTPYSCYSCTNYFASDVAAYTIPVTGASNLTQCLCPPGYNSTARSTSTSLQCFACPSGTFSPAPTTGFSACLPCAINAVSPLSRANFNCTCPTGYADYTVGTPQYNPDGRGCQLALSWVRVGTAPTACSSICDGGYSFDNYVCSDANNNVYPDSACNTITASNTTTTKPGVKPNTATLCNTQPCINDGYTPQFSSGAINMPIVPQVFQPGYPQTTTYVNGSYPFSVVSSTINVNTAQLPPLSAANPPAIHLKISFPGPVQNLQISVLHFGVPVVLFDQTPAKTQCDAAFGFDEDPTYTPATGYTFGTGPVTLPATSTATSATITTAINALSAQTTELVFTDVAAIPYPACQTFNGVTLKPEFEAGESYIIRPYSALSALNGLPAGGDWTINIVAPTYAATPANAADRVMVSWGLTFNPVTCPLNTFLSTGSRLGVSELPHPTTATFTTAPTCSACPADTASPPAWYAQTVDQTFLNNAGNINSCPCPVGRVRTVTTLGVVQCTACKAGTYKSVVSPFGMLVDDATLTQPQCSSCNTCASPTGSSAITCSSSVIPGYQGDVAGATSPATGPANAAATGCGNTCAPGYYTKIVNGVNLGCQPAEIGSYATGLTVGTTSAIACSTVAVNSTTSSTGSVANSNCVCAAGTVCFGGSGTAPCTQVVSLDHLTAPPSGSTVLGCSSCAPGYYSPASSGTSNYLNCLTCDVKAAGLTSRGSSNCTCDADKINLVRLAQAAGVAAGDVATPYTPVGDVAGTFCAPKPQWRLVSTTACDSICDGGKQTLTYQCMDALDNTYCQDAADGTCATPPSSTSSTTYPTYVPVRVQIPSSFACGPMPPVIQRCNYNTQCINNTYIGQYSSGFLGTIDTTGSTPKPLLGYPIPYSTGTSAVVAALPIPGQVGAATPVAGSIVVPNTDTTIFSPTNQLILLLSGAFTGPIRDLRIELTKVTNGVTTVWSNFISNSQFAPCAISMLPYSQVILGDQQATTITCALDGALFPQNSYAIRALNPLVYSSTVNNVFGPFNGQPAAGTYSLKLWSVSIGSPVTITNPTTGVTTTVPVTREVYSWGITVKPNICLQDQYLAVPSTQSNCFACPPKSTSVAAGINTINSCPCALGTDARFGDSCVACDAGYYRDYSSTFGVPRPQSGGNKQSRCVPCGPTSTSAPGATSRAQCSTVCGAGAQAVSGGGCAYCPAGTFRPATFNSTTACASCPAQNQTTAVLNTVTSAFQITTGEVSNANCVCAAGYYLDVNNNCVPCGPGTFKALAGPGTGASSSCANCPVNSFSGYGAAQCTCSATFTDYNDGLGCTPNRFYQAQITPSSCANSYSDNINYNPAFVTGSTNTYTTASSSAVACDTGYAQQTATCTSATPGSFACPASMLKPDLFTSCSSSFASCAGLNMADQLTAASVTGTFTQNIHFTPQFGSGYLNAPIRFPPTNNLTALTDTYSIEAPKTLQQFPFGQQYDVFNSTNNQFTLAVHVTLDLPSNLETVQLSITHCDTSSGTPNCATVDLFKLDPTVTCLGYVDTATFVFSDQAGLSKPTCAGNNLIQAQAGETYVVKPSGSLMAAFNNMQTNGIYTLNVRSLRPTFNQTLFDAQPRALISWGVTFGPTICPANSYLVGGAINAPAQLAPATLNGAVTCVPCALNASYPVPAGLNTVNSCPLKSGFAPVDSTTVTAGTAPFAACAPNTYRQVSEVIAPQWQQINSFNSPSLGCVPCHSTTTGSGTAYASQCSTNCDVGYAPYFPVHGSNDATEQESGRVQLNKFNAATNAIYGLPLVMATCRPCGHNQFKATTGSDPCLTCGDVFPNSIGSGLSVNAFDGYQQCVCKPGYYNDGSIFNPTYPSAPTCNACPVNTTKVAQSSFSVVEGVGACVACGINANAPAGSTKCVCNFGYADISVAKDASNCVPTPFFVATTNYTSCSLACGGGIQTRLVNCTDVTKTFYDDSVCLAAGLTKPPTSVSCNTQGCTTFGYVPAYDSGILNYYIPTIGVFTSEESDGATPVPSPNYAVNNPAYAGDEFITPLTHTITVSNTARIIDMNSIPQVHFTAEYPGQLQSLRVSLFHAGVSVTLFELEEDVDCSQGYFAKGGSQVIFSDQAGMLPVRCSTDNQVKFLPLQSYAIRPFTTSYYSNVFTRAYTDAAGNPWQRGLTAFNNLPVAGDWILTVFAVPTQFENTTGNFNDQNLNRRLNSWGLTFGATVCPESSYTTPTSVLNTCTACPANSLPAFGGVNTANSCPCASGYFADYTTGVYQCVACPIGTFRSVPMTDAAPFNNYIGANASCSACNGFTPTTASISAASCGLATVAGFSAPQPGYCYDGYQYVAGSVCSPCPVGTGNPGSTAVLSPNPSRANSPAQLTCNLCPVGFFSNSTGTTICQRCATPPTLNNVGTATTSVSGATRCSCAAATVNTPAYFDYGETNYDASGSGCRPIRTFVVGAASTTCSARCDGGYLNRTVTCQDASGTKYDLSSCLLSQSAVASLVPCNTQSCTTYGYVPQFASGSFDAPIPVPLNQLRLQQTATNQYTQVISGVNTITNDIYIVPNYNSTTALVSSQNEVAVHFTSSYIGFLNTLEVSLTHAGVTVQLFNIKRTDPVEISKYGTECTGGILSSLTNGALGSNFGAQLIFSDQTAAGRTPRCGNVTTPLYYYQGNVYVTRPVNALSSFWGLPATGRWTITIKASADQSPISAAALASRVFVSWGLTFNPTVCSADQFVATQTLNSGICKVCLPTTRGWRTPGVNPPCLCPPGQEPVPGSYNNGNGQITCQNCAAGFVKDHYGNDACGVCATNSTRSADGTRCTCDLGFVDNGLNLPSGASCVRNRTFVASAWGACSTQCEGGVQNRTIQCVETGLNGNVLPDSACAGTKDITSQVCNTQPCLSHSFLPQYGSGGLFAPIPQVDATATPPVTSWTSKITIKDTGVIGETNQVAVHFSASYFLYLQTLRVNIYHNSIKAQLFNLGNNLCYGSFENATTPTFPIDANTNGVDAGSQVIFSDQSSLPALYCSNDNLLTFRAGESYVQKPFDNLLNAFTGQNIQGDWIIEVYATQNPFPVPPTSLASRQVISWGLTFAPSVCQSNQYITGTSFLTRTFATLKAACVACPTNAIPSLPGVNTINNCPCSAGSDSFSEYKCVNCLAGSFRGVSALSPITYQQRQRVRQCASCNSAATAVGIKTLAACGKNCNAQYTYTPGQGCTLCPQGSTKLTTAQYPSFQSPAPCVRCTDQTGFGVGYTTASRGSTACVCDVGYETNPTTGKCQPCAVGFYKDFIGAGSCTQCTLPQATTTVLGSSSCRCATNYANYLVPASSLTTNGAGCSPLRSFSTANPLPATQAQCPTSTTSGYPCGKINVNRAVPCVDSTFSTTGRIYNDSTCLSQGQVQPSVTFACEYASCQDVPPNVPTTHIPNSYQPEYGAGGFAATSTVSFTGASSVAITNPVGTIPLAPAVFSHTITILNNTGVVSAANSVAIHFMGAYANALETLQITVTHLGNTVQLFKLNNEVCAGSLGLDSPRTAQPGTNYATSPTVASLIFNDFASIPTPTCDIDHTLSFQAGFPYIIQPATALSYFYGLPVAGDWTINVWSRTDAVEQPPSDVTKRYVKNWGITFGPQLCDDGQYLQPIRSVSGTLKSRTLR